MKQRAKEGYNPQPIIINCKNEKEALESEKLWIFLCGREDLGTGTLLN